MFGHVSIFVALYEEGKLAWGIRSRYRGIGTDDRLSLSVIESIWGRGLYDETRCYWDKRGLIVGQLEHETKRMSLAGRAGKIMTRGYLDELWLYGMIFFNLKSIKFWGSRGLFSCFGLTGAWVLLSKYQ